jgi:DNA-binding response OmpR family regulator
MAVRPRSRHAACVGHAIGAQVVANRSVVVVEDDAQMREALNSVLDAGGYRAKLYATAEAALDADAFAGARCAVLDVALPGMSGVELCERLRATPEGADLPLIMITAHDSRHLRDAAEGLGVYAFLVKPFSGRRLASFVDRIAAPDPRSEVRSEAG